MSIRTILAGAVLAAVVSVAPAFAGDLVFMLDNQSSGAVAEFYASPANVNNWEDQILSATLGAGEATRVTIADGRTVCEYDLKFVWEGGEELEERAINLCETGSYTLSD
jgi:hypothetical protein